MSLAEERCEACRPDSPRVASAESETLLAQLPGWRVVEEDAMQRLSKGYQFKDFASALAFTDRVGDLADRADHHPRIVVEWGAATVQWWTHAIGGLHRNDFIMAARTDLAYRGES